MFLLIYCSLLAFSLWCQFVFSSQIFVLVVLAQVPQKQNLRWGIRYGCFIMEILPGVARSRWGQNRKEKEAKQGCDFRWNPSLSLILWGALEHHTARSVLPFEAKELGSWCEGKTGSQWIGIFPCTSLTGKAAMCPRQSSDRNNRAFSSKEYSGGGTGARCWWNGLGRGAYGQEKQCPAQQALKSSQAPCLEHLKDKISLEIQMASGIS